MNVNNANNIKSSSTPLFTGPGSGGSVPGKPSPIKSTNYGFYVIEYVYSAEKNQWDEAQKFDVSTLFKVSPDTWNKMARAGLTGEALAYMERKGLDAGKYLSEQVLADRTTFYSQGFIPVQAGEKILILNGSQYVANLAKGLGLDSANVVFSPKGDGRSLAPGINIRLGDQWVNGQTPLTAALFNTLSDDMQWALVYAMAGKAVPDDFISQDLWKEGSSFLRMYKEAQGANNYNDNLEAELDSPSDVAIDNPSLSFTRGTSEFSQILRQYGMMGNADAWAMGLMLLSSNMQATLTESLTASLEINKKYDDFLFNKTLLLNERLFKIVREGNIEFQNAQAARGKKRTAAERWDSIWDNVGNGDWGKAFEEGISLVYDATVGMITNAIMLALGYVGKELNKLVANVTKNIVSASTQKQIEGFISMWDEMAESAKSSMKLEKRDYGDTALMTEEEAAAKEAEFNTISAEEAEYLTYADIAGILSLTNSDARTVTELGKGTANFIGGVMLAASWVGVAGAGLLTLGSLLLGPLAWFTITPVLASATMTAFVFAIPSTVSTVGGMIQANQVMDANAHAVESNYRQAQYSYVSAMAQAATEAISATRDVLSQQMELLGKDVELAMEFISGLEDLINQILEHVADMSRDAAGGFSS